VEFVEKYREHHLEQEKGDYNGREETFPRDVKKVPYKYNFVRFPADIIHEVYSSYLNASWICGYNDELRKFIVTDLPYEVKHKTFWWMVLQHKISYIVYIGYLPTDGQKKEKPYWPDIEGQVMKFGRINVTLVSKRGFMPHEHDEDDDLISSNQDETGGEGDHLMNGSSSTNGFGEEGSSPGGGSCKNGTKRSKKAVDSCTAIIRQLVLTVTDDDENLCRGEEWRITHVQYLLLEGATGPPSCPNHFAHFVTLLRRNLIGGLRDESGKFSHVGACNSNLNRGDSFIGGYISQSSDSSKPIVVQCLTGGVRSALLCAIWMLSVDLEQTKSCNVPSVVHRLLEQRFTIFPCNPATDMDCFKFVYDCMRAIASGSLDNYSIVSPSDSSGIFSAAGTSLRSSTNTNTTAGGGGGGGANRRHRPQNSLTNGFEDGHNNNNNSRRSMRDSGHFSSSHPPNTSDSGGHGSLRPHHPNSPQAHQDAISFTNNLESPLHDLPPNGQQDSGSTFSTFKRNKMSSSNSNNDYANVIDLQLESSIV